MYGCVSEFLDKSISTFIAHHVGTTVLSVIFLISNFQLLDSCFGVVAIVILDFEPPLKFLQVRLILFIL